MSNCLILFGTILLVLAGLTAYIMFVGGITSTTIILLCVQCISSGFAYGSAVIFKALDE